VTELLLCLVAAIPPNVHPTVHRHAVTRAEAVAAIWPAEVPADCEFLRRIWAESAYRMHVRGKLGEHGLGQVLPATGRWLCRGLRWQSDPADNIRCAWKKWSTTGRRHCRYKGSC
jgi:hypothetical protein